MNNARIEKLLALTYGGQSTVPLLDNIQAELVDEFVEAELAQAVAAAHALNHEMFSEISTQLDSVRSALNRLYLSRTGHGLDDPSATVEATRQADRETIAALVEALEWAKHEMVIARQHAFPNHEGWRQAHRDCQAALARGKEALK